MDNLTQPSGTVIPQKATTYDWAYAYGSTHPHAPTHIGNRTFSYDANGNQTGWTDDNNGTRRIILWDEEDRISEIDDNGERSKYTYDDAGERVIKVSRQGETAYINQYYVVRNRSIVSKHIFAGSARIATHMEMGNGNSGHIPGGGGGNGGGQGGSHAQGNAYGQDKAHGQSGEQHGNSANNGNGNSQGHGNSGSHGNTGHGAETGNTSEAGVDASNLPGNSEAGLENALANGQGNKYGIYKHLEREGDTVNASGEIVSDGTARVAAVHGQSDFLYYYHPDHLGSTGYVTDANGKLYEHIEYFPFGETWVQEHSNTLRTPYLFTGKEFDQETGLYYFGARYYDPRTSVWQSADPILGKYLPTGDKEGDKKLPAMGGIFNPLNLGLYTYAHHNPTSFLDPDGRSALAGALGRAFGSEGAEAGTALWPGVGTVVGGLIGTGLGIYIGTKFPDGLYTAATMAPERKLDRAAAIALVTTARRGAVNLDTSTLRALASGKPEIVAALMAEIGNKEMLVTETAFGEFVTQVLASDQHAVKARAATILSFTSLIPDMPSARVAALKETNSVGAADKRIFGTGDELGVPTMTSDAKFVRGAAAQGVALDVIVHPPESW